MLNRALAASLVASSLLLAGCGAAEPPAAVKMPKSARAAVVVGSGTYEAQGVPATATKPAATAPTGQYQGTATTGGSTAGNAGAASTPAG